MHDKNDDGNQKTTINNTFRAIEQIFVLDHVN